MKVSSNKSFWVLVVSILFSAFLLSGCDSHSDYEKQIIRYFELNLKDPNSAKYEFRQPIKAKVDHADADVIYVYVNAKNSFGGYTGFKERIFAFYKSGLYKGSMHDITDGVTKGYTKIEKI